MKTYIFPGQGSQQKGMGADLFDSFEFLTKKADDILGYSIKELCQNDSKNELDQTQFTQVAIYVVNALFYYKSLETMGRKPDFVMGHSLGEFNALLAAECFSFETGLRLVKKRGELMSQARGGAMAAILNGSKSAIEDILKLNGLHNIDLANFNTGSQIVISGLSDEIVQAKTCLEKNGMMYYPLNTSGAFHSRFMQSSRMLFETYLENFEFTDLQIPVISNVTAKPYINSEIKLLLSRQITSPVKWSESVRYLLKIADMAADEMVFEESGYKNVLTGMVRKITREVESEKVEMQKSVQMDDIIARDLSVQEPKEEPVFKKSKTNPQEQVKEWNSNYVIGTKVTSLHHKNELETRTEAMVLFGCRAVIYVKDHEGYFDLNEIFVE